MYCIYVCMYNMSMHKVYLHIHVHTHTYTYEFLINLESEGPIFLACWRRV